MSINWIYAADFHMQVIQVPGCYFVIFCYFDIFKHKSFLNCVVLNHTPHGTSQFCRGTFISFPFSKNRKCHILFWNENLIGDLLESHDGSSFLGYGLTRGENVFFVTYIIGQISSLSCALPHEQQCQGKRCQK